MFFKKLLAALGVQIIEVDKRESKAKQAAWDQLDRELAAMQARCQKAAEKRYAVDGVRPEEIVVSHSQPDETKAQGLRVIHEDKQQKSFKERVLAMFGLQLIEVQIFVTDCRVQKRLACRGVGPSWTEAYGSLFSQLGGNDAEPAAVAARVLPKDMTIEVSEAMPEVDME